MASTRSLRKPHVVGLAMLAASAFYYAINHFFSYHHILLSSPTMRMATGVLLLVWMGMLWNMFSAREDGDREDRRFWNRQRHELLGVTIPLPYFLHAQTPGYGMLFVLSLVLAATLLTGMLSPQTLHMLFPQKGLQSKKRLRSAWLLTHVLLSTILLGLIGLHIYMVFWYS